MEFRQLEYFVTVANLGNVSRAAEILHVSQPAISKSIHLLEEDVGTELFERNGKRIAVNAAGKKILEDAKEILVRYHTIYQKCQVQTAAAFSSVSLVVLAASELLPELLAGFREKYPQTSIAVVQNKAEIPNCDVLLSSVVCGCDKATHRSVFCEEIGVALPMGHPLAQKEAVSLRELSEYPLISLQEDQDMRMVENYYARTANVSFQHMIECDSPSTMRAFIRKSLGPALVPLRTWPSIAGENVQIRPIQNQKCVRYINVQILDPDHASPAAYALFDYVGEFFEALDREKPPVTVSSRLLCERDLPH